MTDHRVLWKVLCLVVWLAASGSAFGQITSTWFDINPSHSNGDRNSASGGRVNHVGAASDFSKVYAASEWGGLYQSFDQGNTWVKIKTFGPAETWDVKVDPSNNQKVYATSFYDGRVNPQSGISISNDAGTTWTAVAIPKLNPLTCRSTQQRQTQPSAWQIAINPNVPSTVFVGTSCGLARSLDSGTTWTFIDPSPGDAAEQIYAVIAQGQSTVDVIGDNGHFRSTNNGTTWSAVPSPPGPVPANSGPGASLAASPRENYVLVAEVGARNIFESDNGGATWPSSLTLPTIGGTSNVQGRIPYLKTNQLSTSNQFDVWYGDINLFKTTATTPSTLAPGGSPRVPTNSWSSQQDGAHDDTGDVIFDPRFRSGACPAVFSGDGGVFRNTNTNNPGCQGPSWTQPNITPHATWIWGFDGVQVGQGQHALTYGLQDDGGWAATNVAEGQNPPAPNWNNYTCCDIMHNTEGAGEILAIEGFCSSCGRGGFPLIMRDQGGGGGGELSNYPSGQSFTIGVNGRENFPFGPLGYALNMCNSSSCTGGDVYATDNILAPSWTSLKSPTSGTTGTGNIKVANLQGQPNVYYHTGNGDPEVSGLIFRSTMVGANLAGGANWVPLTLPTNIGSVTAYDVDPTNGNHVIISGISNIPPNNFQIFITQDFGVNWNELTNLENLMLGISPAGGPGVFVNRTNQSKTTCFCTFNFTTHWQPSLFKFDPLDSNTIVAGAIDSGVFVTLDNGGNWQSVSNNISPTSASPAIPAPIFAHFSPGRFNASTNAFDVWVGTRGAGVWKVVLEFRPPGR
jgi:hypothetical protein